MTFTLGQLVSAIASIDFEKKRRLKMLNKISKLKGHTIVCGYGRMGEVICKKLAKSNTPFVVIEKRASLIEELKKTDYLFVEGDAANDDNLLLAGVKNAYCLVSVIDSDSDGLYISLASRSMNEELFIISRANEPKAKKRMMRVGANKVVLPFVMSGQRVADSIMNPATEDLFDITIEKASDEEDRIILADLHITSNSPLKDNNLETLGERFSDLIIIGVKNSQTDFLFKPGAQHVFKEGDCLIAMGPKNKFEQAKHVLQSC